MLPEIRNQEHLFPVPKFTVSSADVKDFTNELKGFHEVFSDCFHRSESRGHFLRYMVGQFSELERKSIEPIALNVTAEDRMADYPAYDRRGAGLQILFKQCANQCQAKPFRLVKRHQMGHRTVF